MKLKDWVVTLEGMGVEYTCDSYQEAVAHWKETVRQHPNKKSGVLLVGSDTYNYWHHGVPERA